MNQKTIKIKKVQVDRDNPQIKKYENAYSESYVFLHEKIKEDEEMLKKLKNDLKEVNISNQLLKESVENETGIVTKFFKKFKNLFL